jgi:hypothetical protein
MISHDIDLIIDISRTTVSMFEIQNRQNHTIDHDDTIDERLMKFRLA